MLQNEGTVSGSAQLPALYSKCTSLLGLGRPGELSGALPPPSSCPNRGRYLNRIWVRLKRRKERHGEMLSRQPTMSATLPHGGLAEDGGIQAELAKVGDKLCKLGKYKHFFLFTTIPIFMFWLSPICVHFTYQNLISLSKVSLNLPSSTKFSPPSQYFTLFFPLPHRTSASNL